VIYDMFTEYFWCGTQRLVLAITLFRFILLFPVGLVRCQVQFGVNRGSDGAIKVGEGSVGMSGKAWVSLLGEC